MARSSVVGFIRQYGGTNAVTPAVFEGVLQVSFDPTQASAGTGTFLPAGAIPTGVQSLGGGTGGTNPTADIGVSGTPDGFANEVDADNVIMSVAIGSLTGGALTVDTEIYAGVGASAATGGTTTVLVRYVMQDDGTH